MVIFAPLVNKYASEIWPLTILQAPVVPFKAKELRSFSEWQGGGWDWRSENSA